MMHRYLTTATIRIFQPLRRLLPAALLTLASGGAVAQAALPFSNDTCVSDRNGLNGPIRESRSCASAVANGSYGLGSAGIGNGRNDSISNGDGTTRVEWRNDGWTNLAMAATDSGGNAWASSDLTTGKLRAVMENGWVTTNRGGVITTALARMGDVLTLVNHSGSAQTLRFGYAFDGGFVNSAGGVWEYGYLHLGLGSTSGLTLAGSGGSLSGSYLNTEFYGDGFYRNNYFGGTDADRTVSRFGDPANGVFGGAAALDFILPPGESDLVFSFALYVLCRSPEAACDFGNTGSLTFSPLPQGVSMRSQSGVFLSGEAALVPEPAGLVMMAAGLAALGVHLRRRLAG